MLSNFSKLLFLSMIYVFTKCVEYNKEERKTKRSYETYSFVRNVTDQTGVREAIIALGFLSRKIISCLGFYFELSVLD